MVMKSQLQIRTLRTQVTADLMEAVLYAAAEYVRAVTGKKAHRSQEEKPFLLQCLSLSDKIEHCISRQMININKILF